MNATTVRRSLSGNVIANQSVSGRGAPSRAAVISAFSRKLTDAPHCVQQAQIDYVQQVNYESHVEGRKKDVWTSVLIGGVGLLLGVAAYGKYHSELDDCARYGGCVDIPREPTPVYAASGAAVLFAGGWLVYSFAALPKGRQPTPPPSQKAWTETSFVEATGCGLVPADRPAAFAPPTTN